MGVQGNAGIGTGRCFCRTMIEPMTSQYFSAERSHGLAAGGCANAQGWPMATRLSPEARLQSQEDVWQQEQQHSNTEIPIKTVPHPHIEPVERSQL